MNFMGVPGLKAFDLSRLIQDSDRLRIAVAQLRLQKREMY